MKVRLLFISAALLLLLAGCDAPPMTYAEWRKETNDRLAFKRAGLEYKSPDQLRAEAAEMKDVVDSTSFTKK